MQVIRPCIMENLTLWRRTRGCQSVEGDCEAYLMARRIYVLRGALMVW